MAFVQLLEATDLWDPSIVRHFDWLTINVALERMDALQSTPATLSSFSCSPYLCSVSCEKTVASA